MDVLDDIDLHIRPGETVALVGPTGAGQTTAISGHDIRDVTRQSLVSQMSIVRQGPYLFTGTVKENIRYNHDEVTDEQVVESAKAVGAHEFIAKM